MRRISLLLCVIVIAACSTSMRSQDLTKPLSVEQLKTALNSAMADNTMDREAKDKIVNSMIKFWEDNRRITKAGYEENLKTALDLWYANGRDWQKIPADTWDKLRDADKGRLKLGIDPEMHCLLPIPTKATAPPLKTKK